MIYIYIIIYILLYIYIYILLYIYIIIYILLYIYICRDPSGFRMTTKTQSAHPTSYQPSNQPATDALLLDAEALLRCK